MESPRKINAWTPFLVAALFFVGLVYTVISFNTRNWLWFLSSASLGEPLRIIIVDEGERITYLPGDPEFEKLAPAIEASVSQLNNNSLIGIGLSEDTLADYETQFVTLEAHYATPIRFNTTFRAGEPTQLLIPITGRHAGTGLFFRGHRGEWWYGALRMDDPDPLYSALEELGYAAAAYEPGNTGDGSE